MFTTFTSAWVFCITITVSVLPIRTGPKFFRIFWLMIFVSTVHNPSFSINQSATWHLEVGLLFLSIRSGSRANHDNRRGAQQPEETKVNDRTCGWNGKQTSSFRRCIKRRNILNKLQDEYKNIAKKNPVKSSPPIQLSDRRPYF